LDFKLFFNGRPGEK